MFYIQSSTSKLSIPGPPSPPRDFRAAAYGADFADLVWAEPESDGGQPITQYIVERRDVTKSAFVRVGVTDAVKLTIKASKLTEKSVYMFRVAAVNGAGQSEWAELSEPVTAKYPFDPPGL